jgi:hypothetical protein
LSYFPEGKKENFSGNFSLFPSDSQSLFQTFLYSLSLVRQAIRVMVPSKTILKIANLLSLIYLINIFAEKLVVKEKAGNC